MAIIRRRIMANGSGWYWEVVRQTSDVIARGVTDTRDAARAAAAEVEPRDQLVNGFLASDRPGRSIDAHDATGRPGASR